MSRFEQSHSHDTIKPGQPARNPVERGEDPGELVFVLLIARVHLTIMGLAYLRGA